MKKIAISFAVFLSIIPQMALAAWWNPFSWFKKESTLQVSATSTEILEKRIQELENEIVSLTQSSSTTESVNYQNSDSSTDTKPQKGIENKEAPRKTTVVIKPVFTPANTPKSSVDFAPSVPTQIDYEQSYNMILGKYFILNQKLKKEIESLNDVNNKNESQINYLDFLNKVQFKINAGIQNLGSMRSPKTIDVLDYNKQYDIINSEYNEGLLRFSRIYVIQYLKDHKNEISDKNIHAEVAKQFIMYDKLANTNWAEGFRNTITTQQGVEYIDNFFAELGYI